MSYNLFIAYDLPRPGQNYDAVRQRIRELGPHWQFQLSLFYVHSQSSPEEAFAYVSAVMDSNDRLAVINAERGMVSNWDNPPVGAINAIWTQG